MFFTVVATTKKASVFDVKELTNKNIETNQLWQKDFGTTNYIFSSYGEAMNSKMVMAARKTVKIYDFWPDKDYDVTEDPSSEEESDNELDENSEDFDESDDENEGNRDRGVKKSDDW